MKKKTAKDQETEVQPLKNKPIIEKVKDLVYLDSGNYISIDSIIPMGFVLIPLWLFIIMIGSEALRFIGVNWKTLLPMIIAVVWNVLYLAFVLILKSKHIKKTFELRFLTNGISGIFIATLFWAFLAAICVCNDSGESPFGFDFSLWVAFAYVILSAVYAGLLVLGVHKDVFRKVKEKSQSPKFLAISAFLAALMPCAGLMGMRTSRFLREHASESVQDIFGIGSFVLIIFVTMLAHINLVQYFYCKKYKIVCDENGNTTSPRLDYALLKEEREKKKASQRRKKKKKKAEKKAKRKAFFKKIPLWVKILIGIICALLILILLYLLCFS